MLSNYVHTFDNYGHIYKGSHYDKQKYKKKTKVIVFDLDETLGSFMELHILWKAIHSLPKSQSIEFNKLLDLYPEFLRYGILPILDYVYQKKMLGECYKMYIYTNNQCSLEWTDLITKYFEHALKTTSPIFDKTIYAFKINNKHIELSRSTHEKTHSDFIKCTLLPKTTEICFIDNTSFDLMKNERIYYIQPRSYYHNLSIEEIIDRFLKSKLFDNVSEKNVEEFLYAFFYKSGIFNRNKQLLSAEETNLFVAQKIMYHIKEFFFFTNKKKQTKKVRSHSGKKTRKRKI